MSRPLLLFLGLLIPLVALAEVAHTLVTQAQAKKAHGDFKGAIEDYTQAIAQDPQNVDAYIGRGTVRSLEGSYTDAIKDDTKAIALDPKNAVAYTNRGNARMMHGDLAGAISDYTEAIKLDPHHVRALINRGNIKNLQKKYQAAIEDYTAAIAIDPKNATAYFNRAGAERAVWDDTDAINDFSKAIELNPVDVPAYINRAVFKMQRKDWTAASADLNKCLTLLPADRQAYPRIFLWNIAVAQGQTDPATRELAKATNDVKPPLNAAWGWRIAQYLTGTLTQVELKKAASFSQSKQDRSQIAQADYYIGMKKLAAGDRKGAVESFRECRKNSNPSMHEYALATAELKSIVPGFQ